MKPKCLFVLTIVLVSCTSTRYLVNTGKPWQNKPQAIPGKVECEFYNEGGEGVAYHDTDSVNNGSGKLNSGNGSFSKRIPQARRC